MTWVHDPIWSKLSENTVQPFYVYGCSSAAMKIANRSKCEWEILSVSCLNGFAQSNNKLASAHRYGNPWSSNVKKRQAKQRDETFDQQHSQRNRKRKGWSQGSTVVKQFTRQTFTQSNHLQIHFLFSSSFFFRIHKGSHTSLLMFPWAQCYNHRNQWQQQFLTERRLRTVASKCSL